MSGKPSCACVCRLLHEDQDKNIFEDSVFKDTDSEISWIWYGWTWAEGLVNTGRIKGQRTIGLQHYHSAHLVALFMTELFVSFGSGEHSEVVQREKWTKVVSLPPPLGSFQSLVRVYFHRTVIHSSKIRGQWSWRSQFLVNHCCVSEVIKLCAILFLLNP